MHGFYYTIELLEPLLANSLAGDANSAQSLRYVPGSLVRGAVIGEYLKGDQTAFDAGRDDLRRLFFDARTRYLHAYPVLNDGQRSLPAPLAWHKLKTPDQPEPREGSELFDLSINEERQKQLVGVSGDGFCGLRNERAVWVEVGEHLNIHNQRDAIFGRATEDRGAVFRYEALPAGLKLKGIVLTEFAEDAAKIKDLLDGKTFRFGKSRTAGYGAARVEVNEDLSVDWTEAGNSVVGVDEPTDGADYLPSESGLSDAEALPDSSPAPTPRSYDQFILTMLSETLVCDANGQPSLDPLPALRRKLGSQYTLTMDNERSFRRAEVVGGFNRKWGLPLPQVAAIAAGSTLTIKVSPPIPIDELREWQRLLQADGLGERRVDGFGRIVVEWYYNPPKHWAKEAQAQPADLSTAVALTVEERALTERMLLRLLRRDVDQLLAQAIHKYEVKGKIANSQLSRWRSVIYDALNEDSPVRQIGRVTQFLVSEEEKGSSGWEAMRRARVTGTGRDKPRLTDWVKAVLSQSNFPWRLLTNVPQAYERRLGSDADQPDYVSVSPSHEMAIEYRLRLIDGVLALAAKPQSNKHEG
jgi:CRISPR-associated protein Csx10